jgi:hypothetical protein
MGEHTQKADAEGRPPDAVKVKGGVRLSALFDDSRPCWCSFDLHRSALRFSLCTSVTAKERHDGKQSDKHENRDKQPFDADAVAARR